MKTYTVRSGENIFDVAMNIYGGIEGIFDLLVQNTDAASHTGLSLSDTLKPGMVLNYTEDFMVNRTVADWLHSNNVVARGGECSYCHFDPVSYITVYARQYNAAVCSKAIKIFGGFDSWQAKEYVNDNIVLCSSKPDFDRLSNGDYASVSGINTDIIKMPIRIIKQTGVVSLIDAECEVIVVDWGDNTWPSVYFWSTGGAVEHYYDDGGTHTIKVYAQQVKRLDLDNIGGEVYII